MLQRSNRAGLISAHTHGAEQRITHDLRLRELCKMEEVEEKLGTLYDQLAEQAADIKVGKRLPGGKDECCCDTLR